MDVEDQIWLSCHPKRKATPNHSPHRRKNIGQIHPRIETYAFVLLSRSTIEGDHRWLQ